MHPGNRTHGWILQGSGESLRFGFAATLANQAVGRHSQPAIFAGERIEPRRRVVGIERKRRQLPCLLVLHAPNARKVVIAIRTRRGIVRAVRRAARVIVHCRLIVPIDHIQSAIGSDSRMNRPKPNVGPGKKFRIFPAHFLMGHVGRTVRAQHVVVDETHCGFVNENIIIPTFRPGAAVVEAATGGSRKHPHPIDLQVRLARRVDQRYDLLVIGHNCRCSHACDTSSCQDFLRHHHVKRVFTASCRAVK